MASNKYWDDRALRRLTDAEKKAEFSSQRIKKIYNQANRNIQRDLESVYANYSKVSGLDVQKLKELLSKKETDKVWKNLKKKGLDKYVMNNYKARISRLEKIQAQIYAKAKLICTKEELEQTACYNGIINDSYYKTVYDTQTGTGYDFAFSRLDNNVIDGLLSERWSGKNYSERIWGNTDILADQVSEIVGGALLSGQSIAKTSKQIRDRFNVAKHYSDRLVRTETNHFNNEADALAYEEMGLDKYVFVAILDNRTSPICQKMDNKVFELSERTVGENYPPLHPNCRSKTRGYINEKYERGLKRRAINPVTGKAETIDNISYKEWLNKNNIVKPIESGETLKVTSKNDTITSSNLLDKLNINIKDYNPSGKYVPSDNDIQEKASKLLKMNNKPTILNETEFKQVDGIDVVRVVHEYNGKTAQEIYDNTLYGDIRYSKSFNSSYGRGIYFGDKTKEKSIISTYSKGDSKIINAKLSPKANILEFKKQSDYIMAVTKMLRNVPKELQQFYQSERSLLFMLEKVDGIKIKSNGYYCIYNRGVLIINE